MPKELIHFTIAEKTAERLEDTRFSSCLKEEQDGLLLGSVFHDALFYAIIPGGRPLESLAHKLHGADGQDTFALIRMQAEHAASSGKSLPAAILVGMVSHLFADATMHPMVWHFTGNYYADDPAAKSLSRQRHRALESLMDMVVCPEKLGRSRYRLRTLLRRCDAFVSLGLPVAPLAALAKMPEENVKAQLATSWGIFAGLQAVIHVPWLARALFGLRSHTSNFISEVACLFYAPQLMKQADFLQGKIQYSHPVTNETTTSSLVDLMDTAVTLAESLCRKLEPVVFDGAPLSLPGTGPSMDAGMSNVPSSQMLHFSQAPFPVFD